MVEAAENVVRFFCDDFMEAGTGTKSCVLVRFFKTHDYTELNADLKAFADQMIAKAATAHNFKCFTLLATRGINAKWNSPNNSQRHRVIPLPSDQAVEQIPMMRSMLKQMGMDIPSIIAPDPDIVLDLSQKTYNVFHIPCAEGNDHIPMQAEFVKPYGVKSVLGFGSVLPSGNVFVVIIFSRTAIDAETANRFVTMALNVKMAIIPFEKSVFA